MCYNIACTIKGDIMNVASYTFQSPYPSPFQVGRADPSSQKADTTQQGSSELIKNTNTSFSNAQSFKATQTQEVKATVDAPLLDIYA